MADGPRFRGVMTREGVTTSDRRTIGANESQWRTLPITLMALTKGSHGGAPTTETSPAGSIDLVERRPGTAPGTFDLYYEGNFDTGEVGMATAGLVERKVMTGVSIDFAADESLEVLEEDQDGLPVDYLVHYSNVEIGMLTVCPFPAFADCYIELVDPLADAPAGDVVDVEAASKLDGLTTRPCAACSERATELVAAGGPVEPPAAWFADPQLTGPTPLTIDDNGRVFGHLAQWSTCHVGISGQCVTPPRGGNYASFRVASTHTAEGTRVPTGVLFIGTDHAPTRGRLSVSAVQDHYANTGSATADVACGEDDYGVWIAGAMRPGLTPEQVRAARGSVLSGDWRDRGGRLELVAALHVNVPGFPVKHAELVASGGQPLALVAAGATASRALARRERHTTGLDDDGLRRFLTTTIAKQLAPLTGPLLEAQREQARAALRTRSPLVAAAVARTTAVRRERRTAAAAAPAPTADDSKDGKADAAADRTFLTTVGTQLSTTVDLCAATIDATKDADVADFATHLRSTLTAQGATAQHLLDGNSSDGASLVAVGGKATNPVGTEKLMEYWSHGEGAAKIGWGTDGDHTRCVRELGKYVGPGVVHGLCTNLQERAVGYAGNPK